MTSSRLVPISKSPWSLMDPAKNIGHWDDWMDLNTSFRFMEQQMRDMERRMRQVFDQFSQLTPISGMTGRGGTSMALSPMAPFEQFAEQLRLDNAIQTEPDGSKKLKLHFDVRHFKPDELQVKTQDNVLMVQAKHQEQTDTSKFYREYHRQYMLPEGIQLEEMKSVLSPEGVLSIEAPMPALPAPKNHVIPIEHQK